MRNRAKRFSSWLNSFRTDHEPYPEGGYEIQDFFKSKDYDDFKAGAVDKNRCPVFQGLLQNQEDKLSVV